MLRGWVVPPDERMPPRPRPAHHGAPLTEADMADALKALRDWAGLGLVALAGKHEGLAKSTISAHERAGQPTAKFLDAFVPSCLNHRGGLTPQQVLAELRSWQEARTTLDRKRRNSAATMPPPHPAPLPAVRDGSTQQATNGADNPDPAPDPAPDAVPVPARDGAWRRWAALTTRRRRWAIGGTATTAVAAVIGGVIGLHGPYAASGADRQPSPHAATRPLVHSPPYVPGMTYSEVVHSAAGARTYRDPSGMVGEGDRIPNHTTVHVSCKIVAPGGTSVGTYWYRITDPPWTGLYSPTNSFLNDDLVSGSHTKEVDESVPYCPP